MSSSKQPSIPRLTSFTDTHFFLSNFYPSRVSFEGEIYPSVEHAFQAAKTLDPISRNIIRLSNTPGQAKKFGRKVDLRPDWKQVKFEIMYQLLKEKFEAPVLRQRLLETGDSLLIEGNDWGDRVWGCVLLKGDWVGENHLGRLLMRIRSEIKDGLVMPSTDSVLNDLLASGQIQIRRGRIFDQPVAAKPADFDFSKVEGMLLGLAIGDALGITTEGKLPAKRRELYGELKDYIPNRYVNEARGFPSDDTQLAFWTLEQMIADRGFVPDNIAARFCRGRIFGIGSAVRQFTMNYKSGKPWYKSGPASAGNGSLMRIAPMVVPHLKTGGTGIWSDTALCAMVTHNDSASIAGCVSFVAMLWDLLDRREAPDPEWWLERYVGVARELETGKDYAPRGGKYLGYLGPVWSFVQDVVWKAYKEGISVLDACESWHSGAYLLETIPSVIYILMRHGHDPEEAIVRAVNDTKDNDTIAAIVGAAVGALHGKGALPDRWIRDLSGRTTDSDDGRLFELIQDAKDIFWSNKI